METMICEQPVETTESEETSQAKAMLRYLSQIVNSPESMELLTSLVERNGLQSQFESAMKNYKQRVTSKVKRIEQKRANHQVMLDSAYKGSEQEQVRASTAKVSLLNFWEAYELTEEENIWKVMRIFVDLHEVFDDLEKATLPSQKSFTRFQMHLTKIGWSEERVRDFLRFAPAGKYTNQWVKEAIQVNGGKVNKISWF